MIQKSTSLKYEPASEPLHIYVKLLSFFTGYLGKIPVRFLIKGQDLY